jgi:hypothetical protein
VALGESDGDSNANFVADLNYGFSQPFDRVLSDDAVHADIDCGNAGVGLSVSLGQPKKGNTEEVVPMARGGLPSMGLKEPMGVASYSESFGKPSDTSVSSSVKVKAGVSLSFIDQSFDYMTVRPTTEEVIAFGGIPKASTGVRSSNRLGGQPNVDLPQMEKAMKNAQLRDASFCAGKPLAPKYSIVNIPDSEIIHRADRLGVSLGKSDGEVVKSIKGIKMVEEEQILTILQKMWLRMRIRKKVFRLL